MRYLSFGLTTGAILPVLSGVRVFVYPSPLHYRMSPEVAHDIGATIRFGTVIRNCRRRWAARPRANISRT